MSEFVSAAPPSGGITWADHKGSLLLLDVIAQEHGVQTVHGATDPVRATVSVIDGPGSGATFEDTLIFPKLLIGQTKNHVGQKVLGRLGQGNAKPGQSAPWLLEEASAEDTAKAEQWVAQNAKPATTAPTQAPF